MATRRLEALQPTPLGGGDDDGADPPARDAAAATFEDDDGEMLRKLMKQHPNKSPTELAMLAARLMAAKASRKKKTKHGGSPQRRSTTDAILDASTADEVALAGVEETKGGEGPPDADAEPEPELLPVDREAMAAFSKINGGGAAPGVDDLRGLLMRTMQPGAFDDPDTPNPTRPAVLGSMERIGAAGVAAVEKREREQRALAGGAGAALRPKPPKGSDAMYGRMLGRLIKRSSPDVQLVLRHPGLWERWVAKLDSKGFFAGAKEGTPEHDARVHAAMKKFAQSPAVLRFGESGNSSLQPPPLALGAPRLTSL